MKLKRMWKKANPDLKLVSIVEAAVERCQVHAYGNSAIFGSNGTIKSGIYQRAFDHAGIKLCPLTDEQQRDINSLISAGVESQDLEKLKISVNQIVDQLATQNCQSITMACTELPLLFRSSDFSIPIIDTGQVLAEHSVDILAGLGSEW